MSTAQGGRVLVTVAEFDTETVKLDANHPLAGHDLTFELELVEVL
jgi:peptidylprolyl isomerase